MVFNCGCPSQKALGTGADLSKLGLTRLSFPNAFVGNPLGFSSTGGMDSHLRGNDKMLIKTALSAPVA